MLQLYYLRCQQPAKLCCCSETGTLFSLACMTPTLLCHFNLFYSVNQLSNSSCLTTVQYKYSDHWLWENIHFFLNIFVMMYL